MNTGLSITHPNPITICGKILTMIISVKSRIEAFLLSQTVQTSCYFLSTTSKRHAFIIHSEANINTQDSNYHYYYYYLTLFARFAPNKALRWLHYKMLSSNHYARFVLFCFLALVKLNRVSFLPRKRPKIQFESRHLARPHVRCLLRDAIKLVRKGSGCADCYMIQKNRICIESKQVMPLLPLCVCLLCLEERGGPSASH